MRMIGEKKMTKKQRLLDTFQGKEIDRAACICPGGMMNMIITQLLEQGGLSFAKAHVSGEKMAELAEYAYLNDCFENVGVPFCMTVEAEQFGSRVDLGDNTKEPRVIEYGIKSLDEISDMKKFCAQEGRAKAVIDAIRILKEHQPDVPVIGNLTGPISVASSVLDPALFYKALRKQPEKMHEFLHLVTLGLIDFANAMVEAGADVIMIADPSGTGEIMGPVYFENYTVRYLNELTDGIVNREIPTIVHICGQMKPVLDKCRLIRCSGISFDAIVPLNEIRKELSDRIIMGNISTYALEDGTPDKIKQLVHQGISQGIDIISPACGLGMGSPLENIQAILQGVKEEACQK